MPRTGDYFYDRYMRKDYEQEELPPYLPEEEITANEQEISKFLPASERYSYKNIPEAVKRYAATSADIKYPAGALIMRGIGQSPTKMNDELALTLASLMAGPALGPAAAGGARALSAASKASKISRLNTLRKGKNLQRALSRVSQTTPKASSSATDILGKRAASQVPFDELWGIARGIR